MAVYSIQPISTYDLNLGGASSNIQLDVYANTIGLSLLENTIETSTPTVILAVDPYFDYMNMVLLNRTTGQLFITEALADIPFFSLVNLAFIGATGIGTYSGKGTSDVHAKKKVLSLPGGAADIPISI